MKIAQIQVRQNTYGNNNLRKNNQVSFQGINTKRASKYVVTAMIALAALGISKTCEHKTEKDSQGVEYYSDTFDKDERSEYIDSVANPDHTVAAGESLYGIAKKYNVSISSIKKENNMFESDVIYPEQILKIPNSIEIKNVKTIKDASKATGLSVEYLMELEEIENPDNIRTIFLDKNNNETIGVGHKLSSDEISKYEDHELTDEDKYTILVKDLLVREENIKDIIDPIIYSNLPDKLRENVFDYVFHRGETSFMNNKELIDGLKNTDYTKAVANLYMNYTVVKNAKGENVERHLAGLCKRSLVRMGNASKIFKNGIPDEVLESAKKTYEEGLTLIKDEFGGTRAYENVKAEYMNIAYELFDGKIGQKLKVAENNEKTLPETQNLTQNTPVQQNSATKPSVNTTTSVYVNGAKISMTKEQIEADWAKTAERYARPFARPELSLDAKGNVVAFVKEYAPETEKGILSGRLIIVNQGHGGCSANANSPENTAFDPGTSNAVMQPIAGNDGKFKRNKNGELILKETNDFIGNGGKALEEWKVNENFSNNLIEKLTKNGAKVVFISGEVHNAQNAIRKYEREHKVDLFISLHSNSNERIKTAIGKNKKEYVSERITPRGFFIMPNVRGGEDVQDFALAKKINANFQKDNWLVGLGEIRGQSLGVLSESSNKTSSVPSVLIETGNLKNATDVANLNSRDFRERLINATYNGIVEYLENNK